MDFNFNIGNNIFSYDFIRSSANDFWKLDNTGMRDSDQRFQEMYNENHQFLSMNLALEETFSNKFGSGNQCKNVFEFEEREEPSLEADSSTTLSCITALFIENQFGLIIQYIDKHYPLLFVNHPIIKITILKLKMFRHIINHDYEEGFKTLDQLISTLISLNIYTQKKIEFCQTLMQYPDVIKSRYYINLKQKEYLNRLLKLIEYGLLENGCNLFENNADTSANLSGIEEDYLYLKDFEEELMCLLAKFFKLRETVEDFDEFTYNVKEFNYHPRNKKASYIEIDEFLQDINKTISKKVALPLECKAETSTVVQSQNEENTCIFTIKKVKPSKKKEANKFKSSSQMITILPYSMKSYSNILDSSNNLELNGKVCSDTQLTVSKDKSKDVKINKLKPFIFKRFKRENIDKKTLRKFRRYLLIRVKQLDFKNLTNIMTDFINNSLFPPFTVNGASFKSFNTSYLIWIFSHADLAEFYEEYIELNLERMVTFLSETFKVDDEFEIQTLSNYLKSLAKIYSDNQTRNCGNIYVSNSTQLQEKISDENEKISLEQQFMRLSVENFGHDDMGAARANLKMSVNQKEELISRMFDEYVIDMD